MIKTVAGVLLLLFTIALANAQSADNQDVLSMPEQMPEYPGGIDSLIREISAKIVYPEACRDSNIQGKVFVRFIVNEDGSISNIEARAPHPLLKTAAINAIKTIGKFKPAMDKGKVVKAWYSVPVSFKLKEPTLINIGDDIEHLPNGSARMNGVYLLCQVAPEYPYGEDALMKFLAHNIHYPLWELDNNITGRILLRFVVDEIGNLTDITIMRGLTAGLDSEALRVVRMLPKFTPGMDNGQPVKAYFNLPVAFDIIGASSNHTSFWDFYKGGREAFEKLIADSLHYPENLRAQKLEATILVQCKLRDDLKLAPVKVLNDFDKEFTGEALRVIAGMPAFNQNIARTDFMADENVVEIPFHLPDFPGREATDARLSDVYYQTGVTSFKKAEYKVALGEFSDAIKASSINADAYFNRGITRLKLNDPTGACDDFKRAYLLGELDALKGIQQSCK